MRQFVIDWLKVADGGRSEEEWGDEPHLSSHIALITGLVFVEDDWCLTIGLLFPEAMPAVTLKKMFKNARHLGAPSCSSYHSNTRVQVARCLCKWLLGVRDLPAKWILILTVVDLPAGCRFPNAAYSVLHTLHFQDSDPQTPWVPFRCNYSTSDY